MSAYGVVESSALRPRQFRPARALRSVADVGAAQCRRTARTCAYGHTIDTCDDVNAPSETARSCGHRTGTAAIQQEAAQIVAGSHAVDRAGVCASRHDLRLSPASAEKDDEISYADRFA